MGCGCGGKKLPKQASAAPAPTTRPAAKRGPAVWNAPKPNKT